MSTDQSNHHPSIPYLSFSNEVASAIQNRRAVVAIESAVIGPASKYPANTELYRDAAQAITRGGAVPALIAIMDGQIHIGLSLSELDRLARAEKLAKLAKRDLGVALAQKQIGSTTVSSALFCASLAGLPLVVTGAIGGVHRGYEMTLDASADLDTLTETRSAVVCGGAKIILDIARTLEYLETKSVPVLGFKTDTFPAYFCDTSLPVTARLDTAEAVASAMSAHWDLGLKSGLVIAIAPPAGIAVAPTEIEAHVSQALAAAERNAISGKAITPYLLRHLEEATSGLSIRIQREVVVSVAGAAAKIAAAYAHQRSARHETPPLRISV